MLYIFGTSRTAISSLVYTNLRCISTNNVQYLDQRWRIGNKMPCNPADHEELLNSPDFAYTDGRTTPLGVGQARRQNCQKEHAKKMIQYLQEIDYALEKFEHKKIEEEARRQTIIKSKLKRKGQPLQPSE